MFFAVVVTVFFARIMNIMQNCSACYIFQCDYVNSFFHMTITFKNTSFKAHKTNEEIKMQLWKFEYHYPCTLKIRDEIIRKNIWHFELNVVVRIPPLFLPGNNSFHENEFWNLAADILSLKPTGKSLVFPSLSYSSNSSGSAKYMLLSGNLWDVDLCF